MRTEFLCFSVLRVTSGSKVKLASCKSAWTPRWFILLTVLRRWSQCFSYSMFFCGLFYEAICLRFALCYFVLVFYSPFSIAITSLGEERASLGAFRMFVRFALFGSVCFLFLLVSGKGCGLWLGHFLDFSLTLLKRWVGIWRYVFDLARRGSKKSKTDFLCYIGYRNFINDLIKHVSLLILVHVRLLFCPNC